MAVSLGLSMLFRLNSSFLCGIRREDLLQAAATGLVLDGFEDLSKNNNKRQNQPD